MRRCARHAEGAWRAHARANRLNHTDTAIHASQINECLRQIHYRVRDYEPTHPPSDRGRPKMSIGEALHRYHLPVLAEQWRNDTDVADVIADEHTGPGPARLTARIDGYAVTATPDMRIVYTDHTQTIYELKTTGTAVVNEAGRGRPRPRDVDQCLIGAFLAEHTTGMTVDSVIIDYLDTGNPEHRRWCGWSLNNTDRDRARTLIANAIGAARSFHAAPRWFGSEQSRALAPHSPCIGCTWRGRCLT